MKGLGRERAFGNGVRDVGGEERVIRAGDGVVDDDESLRWGKSCDLVGFEFKTAVEDTNAHHGK